MLVGELCGYIGGCLGVGPCPTHLGASTCSMFGSGAAGIVTCGGRKLAIFVIMQKWARVCEMSVELAVGATLAGSIVLVCFIVSLKSVRM